MFVARFDEKRQNILKTHSVGNSGYMIFERNKKDQYELSFRSDDPEKEDGDDESDFLIKQKDTAARSYNN